MAKARSGIDGAAVKRLLNRFGKLSRKYGTTIHPRVAVTYSAESEAGYNYAARQHEDLSLHHDKGQAKFLEQPARENQSKYGSIVVYAMKNGKSLGSALALAGLALLRDSQPLVPVDTFKLKASGKVEVEKQ